MDHLQEHSSVDNSTDGESSQPHDNCSSYDIQTSSEERCDHQTISICDVTPNLLASGCEEETLSHITPILDTNIQIANHSVDVTTTGATPTISCEIIPAPPIVVPCVNYHEIDQVSESGNAVEQVVDTMLDRPQQAIQAQNGKRKREKPKYKLLLTEKKQEPTKLDEYFSKIPTSSTEFTYRNIIPVNVKQLSNSTKLDSGSFGTVYSVIIQGPLVVPMAVKRIPLQKGEIYRLSGYNELTTMKTVRSGNTPYIVDYYCAMIDLVKDELCICMELMDTTVEKFYQAMHPIEEVAFDKLDPFVRRCAHNITMGLYFLETKNIVHRDVKPANMLINELGVVKLCDFGICGNLTDTKSDFPVVVVSAAYLLPIPKQCAIQGDMWALGISLLEIVNGKHPFADFPSYGLNFQILAWNPTVSTIISDDIQEFILYLLKKDAQDRPRSYKDIIDKSFICNVNEMPSTDETDFVRHVIEKITPSDNSNR